MSDEAERHDRIKAMERHEARLANGGRGDVGLLTDAFVEMSRAVRLLLAADYITKEQHSEMCSGGTSVLTVGKAIGGKMPPMATLLLSRLGWPASIALYLVGCGAGWWQPFWRL